MAKTIIKEVAGHKFELRHIQEGIHSEETPDYIASLSCDGRRIATVSNDGHGGATDAYCSTKTITPAEFNRIDEEVHKVTWLVCNDGTKIPYTLGVIADELYYKTD